MHTTTRGLLTAAIVISLPIIQRNLLISSCVLIKEPKTKASDEALYLCLFPWCTGDGMEDTGLFL